MPYMLKIKKTEIPVIKPITKDCTLAPSEKENLIFIKLPNKNIAIISKISKGVVVTKLSYDNLEFKL